jgi:hypothetical protein
MYGPAQDNVARYVFGDFRYRICCRSADACAWRHTGHPCHASYSPRWDARDARSSGKPSYTSDRDSTVTFSATRDVLTTRRSPCNACGSGNEGHTGDPCNFDNAGDTRDTRDSSDTRCHNECSAPALSRYANASCADRTHGSAL